MFSLQIFLYFALEINIKLKRYKEGNFICSCLMITCLISCNVTLPDVIRADFMYALLIMSVVKVQLIMSILNKIYESHSEYIPDSDELCDSLTAIFEKM